MLNREPEILPLRRRTFVFAAAVMSALALAWPASAQQRFVEPSTGTPAAQVATGRHGMVASQERQATQIGLDVLKRGGNAVDAAVAVGFALAVTAPKAGNIGGGGFMVAHLAGPSTDVAIDYRETAPAATTKDVFLSPDGQADPAKSRDSGLGVGVPGTVAGLALALGRFGSGKFSLEQLSRRRCGLPAKGSPLSTIFANSSASGHAARAMAKHGADFPQTRRQCAASRRDPGPAGTRRYARGDRPRRPARLLQRTDRRQDRRVGTRGRRPDDPARPRNLCPGDPRFHPRNLPGL